MAALNGPMYLPNNFIDRITDLQGRQNSAYQPSGGYIASRNRNSDTFASDTYADLVNNEYADYKSRFEPYEKKLMSLADSEQMLDDQLSKISATSKQRFNMARANSALMGQKFGVNQSARQSNFNDTQSDLQRGLSISNAKNMSRLSAKDRQMGILSGAGATRQYAKEMGE